MQSKEILHNLKTQLEREIKEKQSQLSQVTVWLAAEETSKELRSVKPRTKVKRRVKSPKGKNRELALNVAIQLIKQQKSFTTNELLEGVWKHYKLDLSNQRGRVIQVLREDARFDESKTGKGREILWRKK